VAEEFALNGVRAVPPGEGSGAASTRPGTVPEGQAGSPKPQKASAGDTLELSPEAKAKIAQLQQRDQEVRAHEAAHMAAGGGLVRGGATYGYTRGPDGKQYAVSGEVTLDTSPVPDNPAATLQKAQQIKSAAMAPANPSPQDRRVAAEAGAMALKAAAELAQKAQKGMGSRVDLRA